MENEIKKFDKRKYKVNDYFFENPNLINSYYAGFIAADGNISSQNENWQDILVIGLSSKDRYFLQKFLDDLESNYPIFDTVQHGHSTSYIHIVSDKISKDLEKNFNIVKKKSLILTPPEFENEYLKDTFIMGIIDGDGTIGYTVDQHKQKYIYLNCVGTIEMMTLIKNRFEEILNEKTSNLFLRDKSKNYCQYRIGHKQAREIIKYYYEHYKDIPVLNRKWNLKNYEYCINFKKKLPECRRKGVNVFNLDGKLIKTFSTLKEATEYTGISSGRISNLCKLDDSNHKSGQYMFSRSKIEMDPYAPSKCVNKKYLIDNDIEETA